ncbi:MAG: glycosyltransferase family 2 protein [Verrucomicrobiota bacterium]
MNSPKISVCIATYNYGRYLRDCMDSILNQSFKDFELIICDNASSDDTKQVVSSYSDVRIRYFCQDSNIGPQRNFNTAIGMAKGEYIKLMCADDVMLEKVLEDQAGTLDRASNVGMVSCDNFLSDESLCLQSVFKCMHGEINGEALIAMCNDKLLNLVGGPSNHMFRASALPPAPFDQEFKYLSDLLVVFKVLRNWDYSSINRPGYIYRRHSLTDTNLSCPNAVLWDNWYRLVAVHGRFNAKNIYFFLKSGQFKIGFTTVFAKSTRWALSGVAIMALKSLVPKPVFRRVLWKVPVPMPNYEPMLCPVGQSAAK